MKNMWIIFKTTLTHLQYLLMYSSNKFMLLNIKVIYDLKALWSPCSTAYRLNPLLIPSSPLKLCLFPPSSHQYQEQGMLSNISHFESPVCLLSWYCNEQNNDCTNIKVKWTITRNKAKLMEMQQGRPNLGWLHFKSSLSSA